ncbi:hypothetical protein BSKO_07359 [Bryopsis sp. KO-2023]|nr:hypothetical protein BSKO_07359 [Bryopsis sp. KO-2023]
MSGSLQNCAHPCSTATKRSRPTGFGDVSLNPATRRSSARVHSVGLRGTKLAKRCCVVVNAQEDEGVNLPEIPDTIPLAGVETDWRQFRAKLVETSRRDGNSDDRPETSKKNVSSEADPDYWAHPISSPEPGCLLLAHPLLFNTQQTYFSQAVLLIFAHNETGTAGLILNRLTGYKIGKVTGADFLCPAFADNVLYLGGDVGKSTLHLIHGHGDVEGSREVVSGVYIGGHEDACNFVSEKNFDPQGFKWFGRYCGWAPGQLEEEMRSGVWFTAAASPKVILKSRAADNEAAVMWHEVLQMMGGKFAKLSDAARETYRPDIMGEEGGK